MKHNIMYVCCIVECDKILAAGLSSGPKINHAIPDAEVSLDYIFGHMAEMLFGHDTLQPPILTTTDGTFPLAGLTPDLAGLSVLS